MTFKNGDKIKFINNTDMARSYALTLGKTYTATRDSDNDCIHVTDDNGNTIGPYAYRFELVKVFGAANLKPGMRVKFATDSSGGGGIVVRNAKDELGIACNTGGWVDVHFDDKRRFYDEYNIIEVYEAPNFWDAMDKAEKGELVWKSDFAAKLEAIAEADAAVAAAEAALEAARTARAAL